LTINYDRVRLDGHNVIQFEKNIHVVENFIDPKDANFLVELGNSLTDEQWKKDMASRLSMDSLQRFGTEDFNALEREGKIFVDWYLIDKVVSLDLNQSEISALSLDQLTKASEICNQLTKKIEGFLDNKKYFVNPFLTIRRHYANDEMAPHNDQKNMPEQRQSCVVYLNDDYRGGDLYFTGQELEVRPPKYSLAIFNNGQDYMHGVRPVGYGPTRYTLASYIAEKVD